MGTALGPELRRAYTDEQAAGRTAILVAWGGQARGVLSVADTVKPTSAEAVQRLRTLGLRPVLLTGDRRASAESVAAAVGIDDVVAEVRPQDKVAEIVRLQRSGARVAMIGDGVNDAAALAQADLGIAVGTGTGTGTDAAIEASEINLFWAFAYNVSALPLAALGFLNPMFAGAAMALSSLFVVGSSLQLRRFR